MHEDHGLGGLEVGAASRSRKPEDEAEGRREAAFRDSEAREREAEAEAQATRVVSEAISKGNTQAINYFVAQKYVDAISQFATSPNAKTILFPVEATQLIGTLGGIGELVKDALGHIVSYNLAANPKFYDGRLHKSQRHQHGPRGL